MHGAIFYDMKADHARISLKYYRKQAEKDPTVMEKVNFEELEKKTEINPEVKVNRENSSNFSSANRILKSSMNEQWKLKDYFRENKKYISTGGIILNIVFFLYMILTDGVYEILDFEYGPFCRAIVLSLPFTVSAFLLLMSTADPQAAEATGGCSLRLMLTGNVLICGIILLFVRHEIHWLSVAFFSGMSILYILFVHRMKNLTPEGAKLLSELEGFKMYMQTAEEHRLNMLAPPERTLELFERLLPYSMALGVANDWCKKFGDVLKRFNYQPEWYNSGKDVSVTDFATTFNTMSTSFDRSVSIAMPSSSGSSGSSGSSDWSSGSDGGGSSGGGGGGGGGRGW